MSVCILYLQWCTVKLDLPHSTLKSVFSQLVSELWKKNSYTPELSIASSILERLNMLLPLAKTDAEFSLDKTQMFSESARLNTFLDWPHLDYKYVYKSHQLTFIQSMSWLLRKLSS